MERTIIHEELEKLVNQIITLVNPLQIVLFGSFARDSEKSCNDIDLLIVMPDGTHRRKTSQMIYRSIHGVDIPFDIVVTTISDIEKYKDTPGLIYRTALREGKVLYAA